LANDKILEIGAGCGVQSIVAYKTLQRLGNTKPTVYALEMVDTAFANLKDNLSLNSILFDQQANPHGVNPLNGQLISEVTKYIVDRSSNDFVRDEDGEKEEAQDSPYRSPTAKVTEIFSEELNDYETEITNGKLELSTSPPSEFNTDGQLSFSLVIADLPYVDTGSKGDLDDAFFDPGHNAHKTLFLYFATSRDIAPNARLLTSFSSLGGEEDVIRFEELITDSELVVLNKTSFIEDGYQWMVYTLIRLCDYKAKERFWWDYLNCNAENCHKPPPTSP
jgi:hypothetical protein